MQQPPLELYLRAMGTYEWDDLTILTWVVVEQAKNPTCKALDALNEADVLQSNVELFHARDTGGATEPVE